MTLFEQTGAPERLRFFDGQRLFADDLETLNAFHAEMDRLHLQHLHQAGIGNGLQVEGQEGDREIRIRPGFAVDDLGRAIVLVAERVEPVPAVAGSAGGEPVVYDLTVAYRDDDELEEAEERAGLCGSRGVVRLVEQPVFCWIRLGADGQPIADVHKHEIQTGRKIVIARAEVRDCKLRSPLSIAQRLAARPPTQPFIACGHAVPEWRVRREGDETVLLSALCSDDDDDVIELLAAMPSFAEGAVAAVATQSRGNCLIPFGAELSTVVDTHCAGFRVTPCYSARIEGDRLLTTTTATDDGSIEVPIAILDALLRIESSESAADQFVLHAVPMIALLTSFDDDLDLFSLICDRLMSWRIAWMGVEG